ncbi:hypothetical protein HHL14_25640 [Paraburkholderia sp. G-4-1-8]|uniref:Uncharacterized protein n=1 Tax=Paraburkholderia antibiotica TaxID=2728839 RepID=A0A7Y0A0E3_9BURK|nr:hypothetical protein [Paraburkholderia antibiotica]
MTVHFDYYPQDRPRIGALEHQLRHVIRRAGVGELGDSELHADGNDGYLYMYGPDADRLYAVTSPILQSSRLMKDAEVTKRYGSHTETFALPRNHTRVVINPMEP